MPSLSDLPPELRRQARALLKKDGPKPAAPRAKRAAPVPKQPRLDPSLPVHVHPARVELSLPYPPSTNRYWRVMNGHIVESPEAKAYKAKVAATVRVSGAARAVFGAGTALRVTVDVYRPRLSGDLDNRLKVVLDALQGLLFEDDAQVKIIHMEAHDDAVHPGLDLALETIAPDVLEALAQKRPNRPQVEAPAKSARKRAPRKKA